MPKMKISAIIPAYNSQDYILDAIHSIQNQSHPIDEIIIVDDGSTDNTQHLIEGLPHPIVYIKQQNQGPSAARNKGIELAKGDWVAFLDADDQWTNDKIKKQLAVLKQNPELHLIAGDMQEIGINNEMITKSVLAKHNLLAKFQTQPGAPIKNALAELVRKNFIPTGTVLAKRATLLEVGKFNTQIRFGEDLELWAKVAAHYPITCLPEILMLRRLHGLNATQSTALMLADLVAVMQSIRTHTETILKQQNVDTAELVSNAWSDLGYWHFVNENYTQAKNAFYNAIKEKPNKRSLTYLTACLLPQKLTKALRKAKQNLSSQS